MVNDTQQTHPPAQPIAAGEDEFGAHRGLGVSAITFKVTPPDSSGVLIIENTFQGNGGGPARHLHYEQDEWFYALEGEFIWKSAPQRWRLKPGDSILAPRMKPHVWAFTGAGGQTPDRLPARRPDGRVLPRGDAGKRDAGAGPGTLAGAWYGAGRPSAGIRVAASTSGHRLPGTGCRPRLNQRGRVSLAPGRIDAGCCDIVGGVVCRPA